MIFESCFIMSVLITHLIERCHILTLLWAWPLGKSFCTTSSSLLTALPFPSYNSVSSPLFLWRIYFKKKNRLYSLFLLIVKLCLKILYPLSFNVLYPRTHMINLCFSLVQPKKIIFIDGCACFQLSQDVGCVSFFFKSQLNENSIKYTHQIL